MNFLYQVNICHNHMCCESEPGLPSKPKLTPSLSYDFLLEMLFFRWLNFIAKFHA